MDRTNQMQYQIAEGAQVRSADDEKLGKVVAVEGGHLVVEKGFFFPTDYYIPTSAIASYEGDTVYLNVAKDAALNSDWGVAPVGYAEGTTVSDGYGTDRVGGIDTTLTGVATETPFEHGSRQEAAHIHADDRLVVPVHEEELTATKRSVERGEVRIEKDVIAEERTLEVPVTEERVYVERRTVDRAAGADEVAFEEATFAVPVRGEEVDLQKRVHVAEEVEIGKEAVGRTERVSGTVRREEVRVDDTTVVDRGEGLIDRATDVVDDATSRRNRR